MRVRCSHGYFFFDEVQAGDVSRFCSIFGFELIPVDNYYTFKHFKDAPDYSLKNLKYVDPLALAIETFCGMPWEVMRRNKLVYDFTSDTIKPISSITKSLKIDDAGFYFFSDGLVLPGSVNTKGKRVTDFTGYFTPDAFKFRYTEVLYDQNI